MVGHLGMSLTNNSTTESMPDLLNVAPSDADPNPKVSSDHDIVLSMQATLAENSNQSSDTVAKLKAAVEEVVVLIREHQTPKTGGEMSSFVLTGGTSSHIVAVLQGLLKVIAGIEITFTLTSKSASDENGGFADLYTIKWSFLIIPPITVITLNLIGIAVGACRTIYGVNPQWGQMVISDDTTNHSYHP
ncbi:hypothetical protein DKX38_026139 [Salix brachista]|uniref:Uncharacterized protein n=1 Tax=Salix brachista TaxID=2182728 RepID=A0A5N5JW23_9ROSI|nr:hypothetical protein DKX38_026139 [Salix brachista]